MSVVILVAVVIGILCAVASAVWVAIALVKAISSHRAEPAARCRPDGQKGSTRAE